MSEFVRRIDEEIYDKEEYEKALNWVKEYCPEGPDNNVEEMQRSRSKRIKTGKLALK